MFGCSVQVSLKGLTRRPCSAPRSRSCWSLVATLPPMTNTRPSASEGLAAAPDVRGLHLPVSGSSQSGGPRLRRLVPPPVAGSQSHAWAVLGESGLPRSGVRVLPVLSNQQHLSQSAASRRARPSPGSRAAHPNARHTRIRGCRGHSSPAGVRCRPSAVAQRTTETRVLGGVGRPQHLRLERAELPLAHPRQPQFAAAGTCPATATAPTTRRGRT